MKPCTHRVKSTILRCTHPDVHMNGDRVTVRLCRACPFADGGVQVVEPRELGPAWGGPGTLLRQWLREQGIRPKPGCTCPKIRARMDRLGPAGCREHLDELVDEIAADATRWGFPDSPETRELVQCAVVLAIEAAEREIDAPDSTETGAAGIP